MDIKKAVIDIFEGKKPALIPWQPRIYYWYDGNKREGSLPAQFKDKSLIDVYKELKVSPRYCPETLHINPLQLTFKKVRLEQKREDDKLIIIYKTPLGELKEVQKQVGGEARVVEFACKKTDDLKILEYILKDVEYFFRDEDYYKAEEIFGNLGIPQIYLLRRSPLQLLIINFMGFERTIYALHDEPKKVEEFMKVAEETEEGLYEVVTRSPLKIINFGENLDSMLISPELFKRYLLSYYNRRIELLHKAGKFCHIHIDGHLKGILPFLPQLDFDGFEALTSLPQGDVEIEEIKEAVGDKVLLDGIPAIMFLPNYPEEELLEFTERVVNLFYPHLILGVSDELPPPAEIERVVAIREYLQKRVDRF